MMSECVFCKIVRKEVPCQMVAESQDTLVFHDVHPQAPVHLLLIPKEHIPDVLRFEPRHASIWEAMMNSVRKVVGDLNLGGGFRLVMNCGPDAGQAVDHVHLHLLAGRKLQWPPG